MITLAWDTSGPSQAAALLVNGEVKEERFRVAGPSHSETLLPTLGEILAKHQLQLSQVDLYAVTVGPGSFTGLRIGIATLKAFCRVFDRPVAPVSSLEALAEGQRPCQLPVVACLDARLGEVFAASYAVGTSLEMKGDLLPERPISLEDFLQWLRKQSGELRVVGGGALLHRGSLEGIPQVRIPKEEAAHYIQGAVVGRVGERFYREGKICAGREVFPRYLRVPHAIEKDQGGNHRKLT